MLLFFLPSGRPPLSLDPTFTWSRLISPRFVLAAWLDLPVCLCLACPLTRQTGRSPCSVAPPLPLHDNGRRRVSRRLKLAYRSVQSDAIAHPGLLLSFFRPSYSVHCLGSNLFFSLPPRHVACRSEEMIRRTQVFLGPNSLLHLRAIAQQPQSGLGRITPPSMPPADVITVIAIPIRSRAYVCGIDSFLYSCAAGFYCLLPPKILGLLLDAVPILRTCTYTTQREGACYPSLS